MLFLVIGRSRNLAALRTRFEIRGEMMPKSVSSHASWMDLDGARCFRIIECPDRSMLDEWMLNWRDLVEFEVTEIKTFSDFWTPRHPGSPVYEMAMSYPMSFDTTEATGLDLRGNITEALRKALQEPSS